MPRKSQVRFFESRNAYYSQIRGKQHRLGPGPDDRPAGPNYLAAVKAYAYLEAYGNIDQAGNCNTVRVICEAYLDRLQHRVKPATLRLRHYYLGFLVKAHGDKLVANLKADNIASVIDEMRKPRASMKHGTDSWGTGSVRMFVSSVRAAFNWGIRSELITRNPGLAVHKPTSKTRSRELIITPEQHAAVLASIRTKRGVNLRRLIIALENTGARPGELTHAVKDDWHDGIGGICYFGDDKRRQDEFAHKTSGKSKDRTIRFREHALEMMRELVADTRKGQLLFPTWRGRLHTTSGLGSAFEYISSKLHLPHFVPYAYRHTYATRWLLAGGSIDYLAEVLGNTPTTIREHYSHLCTQHDSIRKEMERIMGTKPSSDHAE